MHVSVPVPSLSRSCPSAPWYVRSWSRVWFWPIPPDTYVDPEVVREYVEEEAERGVHVDHGEVWAYFEREARRDAHGAASLRANTVSLLPCHPCPTNAPNVRFAPPSTARALDRTACSLMRLVRPGWASTSAL